MRPIPSALLHRHLAAVVLTVPLLFACAGPGEPPPGPAASTSTFTAGSVATALERLAQAQRAVGDPEALRRAGGLLVHAEGTRDQAAERQGRRPASVDRVPYRETLALDPEADRLAREVRYDRYDGTSEWLREIYQGDEDRRILVLQDGFGVWLRSPDHAAERRGYARRLPQLLLAEVAAEVAALRWLGRQEGEERIAARLADGTAVTLTLEAEGSLLRRVEYLTDVQSWGDVVVGWSYDDYQPVAGLGLFPRRITSTVGERTFLELEVVRVATGAEAVAELFTVPESISMPEEPHELPPAADPSARARVRQEAPGVYTVRNLRTGFHPLFADLGDCVLAVDAPAGYRLLETLPAGDVAPGPSSAWLSERFLELIGETLPGKPVCWVVLTHFHNDHAGGARAFVAEGATLLVPPGDRKALEALLSTPHRVAPDRLAREPRPARVETVEARLTLGEGERRLEVIPLGANAHTDEMLAVHLPGPGFLFVSDLLTPVPLEAFPTPSHEALDRRFVAWLDASGLDPERVYTMHGTGVATRAHLDKLRRGEANGAGASGSVSPSQDAG